MIRALLLASLLLVAAPRVVADDDTASEALVARWLRADADGRPALERTLRQRGVHAVRALEQGAAGDGIAACDRERLERIARDLREAWHRARCPDGMAYVPAGRIEVPRAKRPWGPSGETTAVEAFYVDRHEVSVGAWRAWVQPQLEALGTGPRRRLHEPDPETPAAVPVTGVTWAEAKAFAAARDGRLPTAPEYERAIRGAGVATWPWGSEPPTGRANLRGYGPDALVAVGSYPDGRSPFGVFDLVGNAAEWSATTIDGGLSPLSIRPLVLGGSFRDVADPRLTWRGTRSRADARSRRAWIGFRVVRDVPPLPAVSPGSGGKR